MLIKIIKDELKKNYRFILMLGIPFLLVVSFIISMGIIDNNSRHKQCAEIAAYVKMDYRTEFLGNCELKNGFDWVYANDYLKSIGINYLHELNKGE